MESWIAEEDDNSVLRLAAAIERDSSHPIATAIVEHARQSGLNLPTATGSALWRGAVSQARWRVAS
ncbi:hypothetical protein HSBAA_PA_0890 (plasmid) [Vreelandella sulfidaeris]|uniref:Uncharacterized protein n=1 Tax=Vreelandella sulfidaeris TaxID=115553 RepID=A0A455UGU2_9GAMM|nr:hypothetical protein HSBAA_PA_0890 [Halomonas sulfidaeris]